MSPDVAAAMADVESVLGDSPVWVQSATTADLKVIVWDVLTMFGEWPDMAAYTPRFLRLYVEAEWGEDEMLFYKLLLAVRPELTPVPPGWSPPVREPLMADDVRRSIFRFIQTVLRERLQQRPYNEWPWRQASIPETLAFLAAFDVPLEPFLREWRGSQHPMGCANLCLFLADYTLNNGPRTPVLKNTYIPHLTLLPQNQADVDALLGPGSVAAYLLEHASDAERLGPDWQTGVGPAFDWAMQQAQTRFP